MKFLRQASTELMNASDFYEHEREGLGIEFLEAVNDSLNRIEHHPRACPEIRTGIRRCRTNRFPYGIIYELRSDQIRVIAIMHLSRDPDYWLDRLR